MLICSPLLLLVPKSKLPLSGDFTPPCVSSSIEFIVKIPFVFLLK